jgi:hypothetical protein
LRDAGGAEGRLTRRRRRAALTFGARYDLALALVAAAAK